jgi:hypothetical protein
VLEPSHTGAGFSDPLCGVGHRTNGILDRLTLLVLAARPRMGSRASKGHGKNDEKAPHAATSFVFFAASSFALVTIPLSSLRREVVG